MMTMDLARECVARGATLLDERRPGWHNEINTDTLRIASPRDCALGQLFSKSQTLPTYVVYGYDSPEAMTDDRTWLTREEDSDDWRRMYQWASSLTCRANYSLGKFELGLDDWEVSEYGFNVMDAGMKYRHENPDAGYFDTPEGLDQIELTTFFELDMAWVEQIKARQQ